MWAAISKVRAFLRHHGACKPPPRCKVARQFVGGSWRSTAFDPEVPYAGILKRVQLGMAELKMANGRSLRAIPPFCPIPPCSVPPCSSAPCAQRPSSFPFAGLKTSDASTTCQTQILTLGEVFASIAAFIENRFVNDLLSPYFNPVIPQKTVGESDSSTIECR